MSFQLHIRHKIESAQDHFGTGRVETFAAPAVRVGSAADCECRIDDEAVFEHHFTIEFKPLSFVAILIPAPPAKLYLNEKKLSERVELRSGDEIRIEHWLIRFEKLYKAAPHAKSSDLVSLAAKVLVILILLSEVALAFWLPSRVRTAVIWQEEVIKQKAVMLLDGLRNRVTHADPDTSLHKAAWNAVSVELDSLARYLREHQMQLDEKQWQALYEDLEVYAKLVDDLQAGKTFQDLPELQIETGLESLLQEREEETADEP